MLIKVVNAPGMVSAVPGMFRFVIVVFASCVVIGITAPSTDAFVQAKLRKTIPVIVANCPPPIFPTVLVKSQPKPRAMFRFSFTPLADEHWVDNISRSVIKRRSNYRTYGEKYRYRAS